MNTWIRSAIVVLATGFVGFFGAWQASALVSTRGGLGPSILQTISPISSIFAVLMTVGIASLVGGFVARLTSTTTGMFILGFSLFAMAMKLEGAREFILSGSNYSLLVLEAVFLSAVILLGALVVFAIGGPMQCIQKTTSEDKLSVQIGKTLLISLAILPVIWFIANTPAKGQVIGASAVGGILIGVLSRQFLRSTQPILLFALPLAFGGLGYFIGITISDTTPVAFAQREMSPLLFPMPIEYAAGAIIGLAVGLGWTASIEENTSNEAKEAV